jgi:hypothetical protein
LAIFSHFWGIFGHFWSIFGVFWEKMTIFWVFGEIASPGLFIFQKVGVCRGVPARFWPKKERGLSLGSEIPDFGSFWGVKIGHFWPFLGYFWPFLGYFWGFLGENDDFLGFR